MNLAVVVFKFLYFRVCVCIPQYDQQIHLQQAAMLIQLLWCFPPNLLLFKSIQTDKIVFQGHPYIY